MPMLKTITAHNGCSNIFRYLEDGRALDKVYVGLETPERWDLEMDDTREIAGHDKPTKKGTADKLPALHFKRRPAR